MKIDTYQEWQCLLPFEGLREAKRQERVERIFGNAPKLTTEPRVFDEGAYAEATAIARTSENVRGQ